MFFFQFRISYILVFITICNPFTDSPSYLNGKLVDMAVGREAGCSHMCYMPFPSHPP
jgi:hypothetical protein